VNGYVKEFLVFAAPVILLGAGMAILGLSRRPVARINAADQVGGPALIKAAEQAGGLANDAAQANGQSVPPVATKHSISVTFDYNFAAIPACTGQNGPHCVQDFVVYDISAGADKSKRSTLFTIPVPAGAKALVHGITGTSPKLTFESGKHLIAVVAQEPGDNESDPSVCSTWVTIP
jgi:hypothetical protein